MKRNFTILILGCLLTAACGVLGGGRKAAELVTRADAENIMGFPMKLDQEKFAEKQSTCIYTDAGGDRENNLQMTIQEYLSEEQARESHESMKILKHHYGNIRPVKGIGDAAWLDTNDYGQAIYVKRKNFVFLINVEGGELSEKRLAELRRVAESVAARL